MGFEAIHLQALELICQQKGIGVTELDNTLSKIFVEKSDTIPVAAFENLFGMHEYAASMSIKHELPTLLHFAAKYGLKDFTCHLIDLPGALLAYSISNTSGDRPAEIARKNKHMELANYFDTYIEMNGTLYELMEPYMYFSIDTQWCETEEAYYNTQPPGYVGYDHPIPVRTPAQLDQEYMDTPGYLAMDKSMKKTFPMKRDTTKKVPKPTHVPNTPRQKELYDIMMQLYEMKITALEMKRQITEWFSRHAGGTSLKDKQKNLDELKEELKLWVCQDREDTGYITHSNKGEFIQYMLRQCMRQHGSPYYNTKARSGAGQDDQRQQPNEDEYMYTGPKSNPSEPTQGGGLSQVQTGNQQQSSVLRRNRPVSIRMDKLIQDKGIEATPPLPKRQSKPHSHHRDKPPKPIVSPPIKPDLPLREPRTRLL
ncbi:hypothetical protein LSAT2_009083 [Lamellibrachia satsuma]|nr:hypothetical protein LSAT2_009083 [Lamellibrachia satsuma]